MKNWKSMLFALLIFAALFSMKAEAQNFAPLDSTEVALLVRDSDNAHKVAKVALDAIGCMLSAEANEWTLQDCMDTLRPILNNYGQEHMLLHPRVLRILQNSLNRRDS